MTIESLSQLAMHLRYCMTCHGDSGYSDVLCKNAARLWKESDLPAQVPYPMPAEWGPSNERG